LSKRNSLQTKDLDLRHITYQKYSYLLQFAKLKPYPRAVSSYLSTFLSTEDDDVSDNESSSDSDGSFFSYSAKLDVVESRYRSHKPSENSHSLHLLTSTTPHDLQSPKIRQPRPPKGSLESRRAADDSALVQQDRESADAGGENYATFSMKKPLSKHGLNHHISDYKIPRRLSNKSSHSHQSSVDRNESTNIGLPRPKVCDASVQTSSSTDIPVAGHCHFCGSIEPPASSDLTTRTNIGSLQR
jgi:hypothetical protein